MKPTATATRVFYTPPYNENDGGYTPPSNREKYYDRWHVEMEDIEGGVAWKSQKGSFKTQEEAEGFMAGWNAHRDNVKETLFRDKFRRKR